MTYKANSDNTVQQHKENINKPFIAHFFQLQFLFYFSSSLKPNFNSTLTKYSFNSWLLVLVPQSGMDRRRVWSATWLAPRIILLLIIFCNLDSFSAIEIRSPTEPRRINYNIRIEHPSSSTGSKEYQSASRNGNQRLTRTTQWVQVGNKLLERKSRNLLGESDKSHEIIVNSDENSRKNKNKINNMKNLEKEIHNNRSLEPITKIVAPSIGFVVLNETQNHNTVDNTSERSEEIETSEKFQQLKNEFLDQNVVGRQIVTTPLENDNNNEADLWKSANGSVEEVLKVHNDYVENEEEENVSESFTKKNRNEINFGEEYLDEGAVPPVYLSTEEKRVDEIFIGGETSLTKPEGLKFVSRNESSGIVNDNETNSQSEAYKLEMSTEFFIVPSPKTPRTVDRTTTKPSGVIFASRATTPAPHISRSSIRNEPWAVPLLVFSCGFMALMGVFETFVLVKAYQTTPSRRHLFLGQMLILGLFCCCGLAALLTTNPTPLSCGLVRFGAGFAFTLVFAALLVKCVFLISMNSGVYLPATYQALLLMFAVLIQVAIGTQWLITDPPGVENVVVPLSGSTVISSRFHLLLTAGDLASMNPTIQLCDTEYPDLLLSLIYVVFLIAFVSILAVKSRGIRDNYREATYIGLAIVGTLPIWIGWTMCGFTVANRHKDACLAFGLVSTATIVFLVMFMPKGRQLAAMGKEGLYVEDREERFGTLSRTGSGYSPSFFHFKPLKHGRGIRYPPSIISDSNMGGVVSKNPMGSTLRDAGGGGML